MLAWVFLAAPYSADASLPLVERALSTLYVVLDVLVLALAIRMAIGGGDRTRAYLLMTAGWLVAYALWGAAVLDPSVATLTDRAPAARTGLTGPGPGATRAAWLRSCLREHDTVGRLGGDEFAILADDTDLAMYAAKSRGKGTYEVFQGSMLRSVGDRHDVIAALEGAIERPELVVHNQPIVDLHDGRVAGAEALVRWPRPDRGLVPPAEFIPWPRRPAWWSGSTASCCARPATRWRAGWPTPAGCRRTSTCPPTTGSAATWPPTCPRPCATPGSRPTALPWRSPRAPSCTTWNLEVAIEHLQELKALGVHLAIDDFGTGFSSLAYLRQMPIDAVKIDKSFVDGLACGAEESAAARAIIAPGRDPAPGHRGRGRGARRAGGGPGRAGLPPHPGLPLLPAGSRRRHGPPGQRPVAGVSRPA
jgi:EAL domain/Diguanylate cyclase, GGDEF domain